MTVLMILAIGIAVPTAAAVLAQRGRPRIRFADTRGIALQTVIIIVVMLAIAGGVAGVLATRGQQATEQLAATQGPINEGNCATFEVSDVDGTVETGTTAGEKYCSWIGDDLVLSRSSCSIYGGTYQTHDGTNWVSPVALPYTVTTPASYTAAARDTACYVRIAT